MIAAAIPSLMDRSRFPSGSVRFINDVGSVGDSSLVLVDLDRVDDFEAFGALAVHTIGFGSHVDEVRLDRARRAGFDEVLARSAFMRRLPELLRSGGTP